MKLKRKKITNKNKKYGKIFFTLILLLSSFKEVVAQQTFSLSQFQQFTNCKTLTTFDTKIRKFGYVFSKSKTSENSTDYFYAKETTDYVNSIIYADFGDLRPSITFGCTANNYFSILKEQAEALGYKYLKLETLDNERLKIHYENSAYYLTIMDY